MLDLAYSKIPLSEDCIKVLNWLREQLSIVRAGEMENHPIWGLPGGRPFHEGYTCGRELALEFVEEVLDWNVVPGKYYNPNHTPEYDPKNTIGPCFGSHNPEPADLNNFTPRNEPPANKI